jgi:hypothetical protein
MKVPSTPQAFGLRNPIGGNGQAPAAWCRDCSVSSVSEVCYGIQATKPAIALRRSGVQIPSAPPIISMTYCQDRFSGKSGRKHSGSERIEFEFGQIST